MFKSTLFAKIILLLFAGSQGKNACKKEWYPQCMQKLARCEGENRRLQEFNQYLKQNSFEEQYKNISKMYNDSKRENQKLSEQLDTLQQQLSETNEKFDALQSSVDSTNNYSKRIYALIEGALNPNIANIIMPPETTLMKDPEITQVSKEKQADTSIIKGKN